MANYRVEIKRSAAKELEAVGQKRDRQRLVAAIRGLSVQPRPQGCEKLSGASELFRVRAGVYRIVYMIEDDSKTIQIVKIGHRREVYRRRIS